MCVCVGGCMCVSVCVCEDVHVDVNMPKTPLFNCSARVFHKALTLLTQ